jgi:NAD(P)-dependent dehydrogenase (short-subunit alcohol dehydrogenase family)
MSLDGKRAFVSGSTQGIGRAIAARLAAEGAAVTINGRDAAKVAAVAEELGGGVAGIAADVSTPEGVAAVAEQLREVDVLVNNLGIFAATPLLEIEDADWQRFWDVNVMSAVRLSRAYAPGMRDRGWGRLLFLASDSAVVTPTEMVHYGVTKTALLAVSRGFAQTLAGTGVTANTVMAGPTHTEGVEDFVRSLVGDELPWDEAQRAFIAEHRPTSLIGRLIEPDEIASLVAYLASSESSATTGGALRVDGGYVNHILP